ncbi:dolichol phosphate-mannose biosynthesis regulatory protein-like [Octopus bimaculoides]|uniref:dolichol phosphate-mannose biosynthesis regulatory protein-like n=1 Tax=Octopus bimaculoides TaxID=37653 RepID=UPI00071E2016|nr:dolichol phosphate-mannose biosynthesis regulatory protein-like [Octopus bimaculoides]XP_014783492.1 dolichol phosphate-mannose biosynthesis regulatory protein-like [Octopus bimaculoides]XP_014783493.1 dolichol phosphate-mannose biosynthesis regulatory protein-like [Octopus bimaculoides]XP_014783494.1 dolichol phosphate-mannose biosynthesis regulatory protein-like [Octopus bimaculoides]|eukprot:XP_014783491.1 PREDICTED: dolichol phosphate-mannose biosynthesis regulatory protein-like [Octopus bimaculoides]
MVTSLDQTVGWGLMFLAATIFVYYSIWVIILPFLGPNQKLHSFFPPQFYAVAFPLVLMSVALVIIGLTMTVIIVRSKLKAKPKSE